MELPGHWLPANTCRLVPQLSPPEMKMTWDSGSWPWTLLGKPDKWGPQSRTTYPLRSQLPGKYHDFLITLTYFSEKIIVSPLRPFPKNGCVFSLRGRPRVLAIPVSYEFYSLCGLFSFLICKVGEIISASQSLYEWRRTA